MSNEPPRPPPADWYVQDVFVAGRRLSMKQLSFGDVLAASAEGDADPWWAHVWPAGLLLAEHVLNGPRLDGLRAVDLGTGSGIVGIAAGLQGAEVTFSDRCPEALELAADNARRCGVERFQLLELDWSEPPDLRFDVVYASDVVYERELLEALARAIALLTSGGGSALVGDPKRPHLPTFLAAIPGAGLMAETERDDDAGLLLRLRHAH